MKFNVLSTVVALQFAFALTASADYLRWQVPSTIDDATPLQTSYGSDIDWTSASIKYADSADLANPYSGSATTLGNDLGNDGVADATKVTQSNFDLAESVAAVLPEGYSSKFFFIELYDSTDQLVGYTQGVQGSSLTSLIDSTRLPNDYGAINGWAPSSSSFVSVPEPTGAMLMLLGMGLLGLRRRRIA